MRYLLILALSCGLTAQTFDAWGGNTAWVSPSGSTGKWTVEAYPTAGTTRWLITTPAGHGFWCASQIQLIAPSNYQDGNGNPSATLLAAKYGATNTLIKWETALLQRYTGWGFNCLAEYANDALLADMNAGSLLNGATPIHVPYLYDQHLNDFAVRRTNPSSFAMTYPTDQVKDLIQTAPKATGYLNSLDADAYDPNFSTFVTNWFTGLMADNTDTIPLNIKNNWAIGFSVGDQDYFLGMGPGPDDCTTFDGFYAFHNGWMALASVPNYYANWPNKDSIYSSQNWIFTDPVVHAKANLVSYLSTKYSGNISALNTAWGSSYTGFTTAATRYTGEVVVSSTDGTTAPYTHTLAHSTVSPHSLAIKVGGTTLITDPPRNATGDNTTGLLYGRWPDGSTNVGGNVNYSTGVITISGQSSKQFFVQGTGSTNLGTISFGATNLVPTTVSMRLEGSNAAGSAPDCIITNDLYYPTTQWQQGFNLCPAPYNSWTVTGTMNYSTGTITSLTISGPAGLAISSSYWIEFNAYYYTPLPSGSQITVDYDVNGWGVGTTLADETGLNTAWLGTTDALLAKPGNVGGIVATASTGAWTDLSAWDYNFVSQTWADTIDIAKTFLPNKIITNQMSGVAGNGHYGCARKEVVQATAAHSGITVLGNVSNALYNVLPSWGVGNSPIMFGWEGLGAQLDSPFSANVPWLSNGVPYVDNYATQAARGTAYAGYITSALTGRGSGNSVYQTVGIKYWAYTDTTSEGHNYGLVSPSDNAYDGHETVTGSVSCSAPLSAYTCGGEVANYGVSPTSPSGAIGAIYTVLSNLWTTIGNPGTPVVTHGPIVIHGSVVIH
jgi:hypothetical protein